MSEFFEQPLIAVISPCYNAASFIRETYASLERQSYSRFLWIVVDDASSDPSFQILEELSESDPRIVLLRNEENSGAAISRNRAMQEAFSRQADLFAFLDIDDHWKPQKLESSLAFMRQNNCLFSYHSYQKGNRSDSSTQRIIRVPAVTTYADIVNTCPIPTSTVVISADVVGEMRMRPELRMGQDYVFWMEILKHYPQAKGFNEPLTIYNVGHTSLSSNKLRKAVSQWYILKNYTKLGFASRAIAFISYSLQGFRKYIK
ncbi:MAG: glycosyltransferase [Balneolales bacterium]|nr:glycosyltransferase [Balneolales bacterium]